MNNKEISIYYLLADVTEIYQYSDDFNLIGIKVIY